MGEKSSPLKLHRQKRSEKCNSWTLVLDLDETLISYCIKTGTFQIRPYARSFLRRMAANWQVMVWTAGQKDYADRILDILDPEKIITRRLYRDSCINIEGTYVKDLDRIEPKVDLTKTVIVDNIAENFALQTENGIHIKSWYSNDLEDVELKKLAKILQGFLALDDVREGIKQINGRVGEAPEPAREENRFF